MWVGLVLAILAPISAMLVQLAISRKREFLADANGALLTRYPEGLAEALEIISKDGAVLATANNATNHLYIVNPLNKQDAAVGFWANLFSTHPPVKERIKRLRDMIE
jgi:heat shock protein HtpX